MNLAEEGIEGLELSAAELRKTSPDSDRELATLLCDLTARYFYRDLPRAMECALEAREISDRCGFREGSARSRRMIGTVSWAMGELPEALESLESAREGYRGLNDPKGEASCINNLGLVLQNMGEFAQAMEKHLEALAIREELGDRSEQSLSLTNIANICNWSGQYRSALKYHLRALRIRVELDDPRGKADSMANLGLVHMALGRPEEAQGYYFDALRIYEELGDLNGIGNCSNNIGISMVDIGRLDDALTHYDRALSSYRQRGHRGGEAGTLVNLGKLRMERGELDEASTAFNGSLELARDTGDTYVIMNVLSSMADLCELREDYRLALEYHRESDRLRSKLRDSEVFSTLSRLEQRRLEETVRESRRRESRLTERQEAYRELSMTDPLTGVLNRRHFMEEAGDAVSTAMSSGSALSLAMVDIDSFKEINDGHGHQVGDRVMIRVCELLRSCIRPDDLLARYGGDEFVVLFRHCPPEVASGILGRVLTELRQDAVETLPPGAVTLSCGVAGLGEHDLMASDLDSLIATADSRLYLAKNGGRDRIEGLPGGE